jgi:tripartite-type tricarboxylate transporter receptor subunit TctC
MQILRIVISLFAMVVMIPGMSVVRGQDFPNKPVRLVTSTVGSGGDFTSRVIAPGMSGLLGHQVIVDNRGAGVIPPEFVSKAPPDGYTLLVIGGSVWIGPLLRKVPYDVVRDFAPISQVSRDVNVVAVHPSLPVKSVKELIALAKAKPGELNFSTGSTGSTTHLAAELFKSMAGINIVRIPYPGSEVIPLIIGEVQLTIVDAGKILPHAKAGKLRALAVTSSEPTALAPGLPTVAATGLPGYEAIGATGMWAPIKTPAPIINRLNQELVRFLNTAEAKERFLSSGAEAVGSSPDEFGAKIKSEIIKTAKVIKDAGIKVD